MRRGCGVSVRPPRSPAAPWHRLTFELLLAEALQPLLVHVHLDGSEVGHDGQEVLEVDLLCQPGRRLPQVPDGSRATGDGGCSAPTCPPYGHRAAPGLLSTAPAFPQSSAPISLIPSLALAQPSGPELCPTFTQPRLHRELWVLRPQQC